MSRPARKQAELPTERLRLNPLAISRHRLGVSGQPGGNRSHHVRGRTLGGVKAELPHVLRNALGGDEARTEIEGQNSLVLELDGEYPGQTMQSGL